MTTAPNDDGDIMSTPVYAQNSSECNCYPQVSENTDTIAAVPQDLLGEIVVDKLSGQLAEVVGLDSEHGYRIEFLGDDTGPTTDDDLIGRLGSAIGTPRDGPYEPGHSAWRTAAEIAQLPELASGE